ncbi:hypothetical protein BOC49_35475 [Burkholderia pseudomallei]|nr:hypothetical protein BOC49_35475 [Burkholderia pseudomallei]
MPSFAGCGAEAAVRACRISADAFAGDRDDRGDARPARSNRRRDRSLGAVSAVERVPSGSTCIPLGCRWGPDGAETTLRLRFASASAAVSRRDWNAGPQRGEPAREGFAG